MEYILASVIGLNNNYRSYFIGDVEDVFNDGVHLESRQTDIGVDYVGEGVTLSLFHGDKNPVFSWFRFFLICNKDTLYTNYLRLMNVYRCYPTAAISIEVHIVKRNSLHRH